MKNLSIKHKIILLLNYLVALLLLIAFIVPYLPQSMESVLSLSSLIFPYLILVNFLFALYWLFQFKKYLWISTIIILLNYNNLGKIYQYSGNPVLEPKGFSIMSYNVRLFNTYNWIKKKGVAVDISNFLKDQAPDILVLQEFKNDKQTDFSQYKYQHIVLKGTKRKAGLAVFSKYKIVAKGNLDLKNTYNNAIWADFVYKKDTIRLYNIHLQSFKIVNPTDLVEQDKTKVSAKLVKVFKRQHRQAEIIQKHIEQCPYPVITVGDFNNTAFSAPYRILKTGKQDAFVQAGEGFGITWRYKFLPLRIDFIMPDNNFKVERFETLNYVDYSDHYPIKTQVRVKEK